MDRLLVSRTAESVPEIFASVQGEGLFPGHLRPPRRVQPPPLLVRYDLHLGLVTIRPSDAAEPATPEEVRLAVEALPPLNVVVTRGEPFIQRPQLLRLLESLKAAGYRIELETNGTIAHDQWNVSPKPPHRGNEGLARIRALALRSFAACDRASFKFVVRSQSNLSEFEGLRARLGSRAERVVLMSEGRSSAERGARSSWLAELCTLRGYRLSPCVQILSWGDRRGV